MKIIFKCYFFIFFISSVNNAVGDVGPCNEDYYFSCDSEDNCTCIKKAGPGSSEELTLNYEKIEFNISRGFGETLEIVSSFIPDPESNCEISYALQLRNLEGGILEPARTQRLNIYSPVATHRRDSMPSRGNREWVNINLSGEATGCSVEEILSASTNVATYHGNSGQTIYQTKLRQRFRFNDLGPDELPPILPADSTLGTQPVSVAAICIGSTDCDNLLASCEEDDNCSFTCHIATSDPDGQACVVGSTD